MSDIVTTIIVICAVLASGAAVAFYKSLEARIKELEKASDKRHLPYKVAEEIEDAMAGLIDYEFDIQMTKDRIDNVLNHLKKARNNR